jgi:hypothetical protein
MRFVKMSPQLAVVADNGAHNFQAPAFQAAETVAERVRRLQTEARSLARDHVASMVAAMADLERLADEIAKGGEAYPAGVREAARQLAEELGARGPTVSLIATRA